VKNSNLIYRPDIDGLRAVAVLAVIFHHFAPRSVPGGFIGVDVFFVISGFLITQQLLNRNPQNELMLGDFYRSRIHRIFPALWVVTMTSLVLGYWLMSPADWVMVARSAISAVQGWSNIFFWQAYGNYFAGNASEAPLLHTWSLGVEEQFYLLWPVMLWFALKLPKRWMDVLFVVVLVSGVIFSELAVERFASASYYLLPTRFFELMLGGWVAWMAWRKWTDNLQKFQSTLMAVLGIALLVLSFLWLSPSSVFPG
jgi:peptidoglycan/LPS O-acetylase OafA/YrhL